MNRQVAVSAFKIQRAAQPVHAKHSHTCTSTHLDRRSLIVADHKATNICWTWKQPMTLCVCVGRWISSASSEWVVGQAGRSRSAAAGEREVVVGEVGSSGGGVGRCRSKKVPEVLMKTSHGVWAVCRRRERCNSGAAREQQSPWLLDRVVTSSQCIRQDILTLLLP